MDKVKRKEKFKKLQKKKGGKPKQFERKKVKKLDVLKDNITSLKEKYEEIDAKKLTKFR